MTVCDAKSSYCKKIVREDFRQMATYKLLISANFHGMSHEQLESHSKLAFDSYRTYQSLAKAATEEPSCWCFLHLIGAGMSLLRCATFQNNEQT